MFIQTNSYDNKPECASDVVFWTHPQSHHYGYYSEGNRSWYCYGCKEYKRDAKVTHWMELPELVEKIFHGNYDCPNCHGQDIEGGYIEIQGDFAVQECNCLECEATWSAVYDYSHYMDLETYEEDTDEG